VYPLRFTRLEWLRALDGVPEADGKRQIGPTNLIAWIVSHLTWHEQPSFLTRMPGHKPVADATTGTASAANNGRRLTP
jgi:hypothetical protein